MIECASIVQSLVNGRSDKRTLDEVVEVSGLQRSVLPVIGEAEQFARLFADLRIGAQLHNRGATDQSSGGAPACVAEPRKLAKIILLATVEGDAATKANQKRCGLKPDFRAFSAACCRFSIRPHHEWTRDMRFEIPLDSGTALSLLPPVIGKVAFAT